ncbi:CopD family protein [Candidatus Bealeia paramacronuclearis]|uniref:Protoporphyrinogen IX oxidase n=1 Tax=Candidatus Bealeia paramacronuclearis TaxID=1921001 RepID=A0ABZ2C1Q8_9PROT|nr:CopD family protein [Candidatus Bealeia paramacronuclearis]
MFQDFLLENYHLLRALHILAFVAWMAGLLYLPRLLAYHHRFEPQTQAYETFSMMERRLLKIIMIPSMIAVFTLGLLLVCVPGVVDFHQHWFSVKFLLVLGLAGLQGFMSKCAREFSQGHPPYSEKFFRLLNEVPFVLLIGIVFLVIFKPF